MHGLEIECNFIIDFPLMFLGSKPCKNKLSSPHDHDERPEQGILLVFSFRGFSIVISQETESGIFFFLLPDPDDVYLHKSFGLKTHQAPA